MNTDFRLSVGFWQHPKTKKTARRLGLEGIRSLQILWAWAAVNRPDGNLSGMDWEDIELAADWQEEEQKFFDTCLGMWIDETSDGYALHDWQEHNPWASEADTRSDAARLSRFARKFPEIARAMREDGVKGLTQEEYRTYADGAPYVRRSTCVDTALNERSTDRSTPAPSPALRINTQEDTTPDGVVVDAEAADASQPGEKRQAHASPACPYDAIVGLYHEAFPEHTRVAIVNAKRKGAMKARWTEAGERLRMLNRDTSAAERLDYFRRLFARASRSDFLTGKKAFRDGTVYRVDFDKLMSPSGFMGVIEGKYDNREVA